MRPRSQTFGTLGRSSARHNRSGPVPLAPPPDDEPASTKGAVRRFLHGALFDNVGLKFVSIVLAITVFLLVNDDKDREITVRVGVLYVMPEDRVLISERVDEVRVTIRGPWRRMRNFDERELPRISVDLRNAPGGEIMFTPDMVEVPSGLSVAGIRPRSMRIAFDRRVEKLVEITPVIAGRPQHGYRVVGELKPTPVAVKVRGGARLVAALSTVRTREVSLEGRTESFSAPTTLIPPDGIELVGSDQVRVQVSIGEDLVTRRLQGLTVQVVGDNVDPARWKVTPAQIEVTLTGELLAVEKAKDMMAPIVRLTPTDRGAREATIELDGVPPGVGVRLSPERVKVTPVTPPPKPPPSP